MIADYTLVRSKRKTIALYIMDGGVEVRAPMKMPKRDIDNFVISKEKWITDKLTKLRDQTERREAFSLDYGDTVTHCKVDIGKIRCRGYSVIASARASAAGD